MEMNILGRKEEEAVAGMFHSLNHYNALLFFLSTEEYYDFDEYMGIAKVAVDGFIFFYNRME